MCLKCVHASWCGGKRPRNTGYSSQSINARSLSAGIKQNRQKKKKKQKKSRKRKKSKRRKKLHSTLQLQWQWTSRFISRFTRWENKFSSRWCHSRKKRRKTRILIALFVKAVRSIFPGNIEFEKCICKFDRWQRAEKRKMEKKNISTHWCNRTAVDAPSSR